MGNFEEHIRYGFMTHILVMLFFATLVAIFPIHYVLALSGVVGPFIIIGSLIPDIDHHRSKPNKILKSIVFIVSTVVTAYFLVIIHPINIPGFIEGVSIGKQTTLIVSSFGAVASISVGVAAVKGLNRVRPKHRGITHDVKVLFLFVLLFGFGLSTLTNYLNILDSFTVNCITFSLFVGILSHLHCDGLIINE